MCNLPAPLLRILAWSYHGALQHHTLQPIHQLHKHQHSPDILRNLLVKFKHCKEKETSFVTAAAIMLTAVIVGVFSWPEVTNTLWVARMLWHSSLWLAVMALISSTQLRMMGIFPHSDDEARKLTDDEVYEMLHVVLRERKRDSSQHPTRDEKDVESLGPVEHNDSQETLRPPPLQHFDKSFWSAWTWQVPLMLMSYGWVCFISGYMVHLLSPIISRQSWSTECTGSLIAVIVGIIVVVNFGVTSRIGRRATRKATEAARQRNSIVPCSTSSRTASVASVN